MGLRVLVEDKEGNNTLPGEVVGVRSQRSCWVKMEGSGRTLLRNRKFLDRDPSFETAEPNVLTLKCMKVRAAKVMEKLAECQQSGEKGAWSRHVEEAAGVLGSSAVVTEDSWEQQAAKLAQQLLRVLEAKPAVSGRGSKAVHSPSAGHKRVRFADHVSFIGMSGEEVPGLESTLGEYEKYRRPGQGRTVVFRQQQGALEGQEHTDFGPDTVDIRQVVFTQGEDDKEEGELSCSDSDPAAEDLRQVVFRQEGGGRRLTVGEILLEAFEGQKPNPILVEQIRQVGIRRRGGEHARVCQSCARLSVVVPVYVRRCELRSVEEKELFISWEDFVAVPGREFLRFFQGALDQI